MSRRKRHVDEEDFDEYAFYDERIRGDAHRRLDDGPPALQDYGLGPGYLGRARQSPRSPSIAGDDEIRPARRRNASPDDSDRGGERRAFRKVGDAFDPDDVFDEPFIFVEPGGSSSLKSAVKNAVLSSTVFRDSCVSTVLSTDADAAYAGNLAFLKQQRVLDGDSHTVRLNNVQLRGCMFVKSSPVDPLPEAVFVELVVLYDRSRTTLSSASWGTHNTDCPVSWSDVFSPSITNFVYPNAVDDMDPKVFNFTNPELSNRVRVMFRKMYKLCPHNYVNTYVVSNGTAVTTDPLLNYNIAAASQAYVADGAGTAQFNISSSNACLIDEFVNLCGLPARYRAGGSFESAVDTEGAVYVGARSTSLTAGRVNQVRVYINTRLNFNMDSSDSVTFY